MGEHKTKVAATSKSGGRRISRKHVVSNRDTKTFVTDEQLNEKLDNLFERVSDQTAEAVQQANRNMKRQIEGAQTLGNTISGAGCAMPQPPSAAVSLARQIEGSLSDIEAIKQRLDDLKTELYATEKALSAARLNHLQRQREFDSAVRERVTI